jgi:hypothetical protein
MELYSYILSALEKIQEVQNTDTSQEAVARLAAIITGNYYHRRICGNRADVVPAVNLCAACYNELISISVN